MCEQCDYTHPDDEDSVTVAELRLVKYMSPDGSISTMDLSSDGHGGELEPGQYFEMLEWGRAFTIAPMVASIIGAECFDQDDED